MPRQSDAVAAVAAAEATAGARVGGGHCFNLRNDSVETMAATGASQCARTPCRETHGARAARARGRETELSAAARAVTSGA
eukprot:5754045-Prymnesium_polylepis.1